MLGHQLVGQATLLQPGNNQARSRLHRVLDDQNFHSPYCRKDRGEGKSSLDQSQPLFSLTTEFQLSAEGAFDLIFSQG